MVMQSSRRYFYIAVSSMFIFFIAFVFKINVDNKREEFLNIQRQQEISILLNKVIKPVNIEHLRCLANNIYHEAGSEPFLGKVAVARVVMNRINYGFGSNPCKVIYQTTTITNNDETRKVCQFSWVCEGKTTPERNGSYRQAEEIARKVLSENKWAEVIPSNVLFFHQASINPSWPHKKVMTIGNHVFYSKRTNKNDNNP